MDMLERYLHAVKFWLPRDQRDDIVAELAEDIRSQIEEQEAALGRKLNEGEAAALLRQRGRPIVVANRYLPHQALIGPALFPAYALVLKLVAACYLGPWVLVWIGWMVFDKGYRTAHGLAGAAMQAWASLWVMTFTAVGIVTILFAVLERVQARSNVLGKWDPRKLPPVRDPNRIGRFNAIFELAANGIFLVWWVNWMWSPAILNAGEVRVVLGPAWRAVFWAFLLLALGNMALAVVNVGRRNWTTRRGVLRLLLDCGGAAVFCWICKANLLVELRAPRLTPERAAELVAAINAHAARVFPFVVLACVLVVGLADVGRLIRLGRGRGRAAQGLAA